MAGWHHDHNGRGGGNGWWRHGNGGYGWVGPLYWPFAYYDMYDYAMWGDGYDNSFWGYGYGDIYAGIFAPYGYDDLAGYMPQGGGNPGDPQQMAAAPAAPATAPDQLAQMCGADSRDIAGLPIDQFQQAIQPTDEQRAALDDLANASVKAAQDIKAACPADVALTAPDRLAAMQKRIEAMSAAVQTVLPPLDKFYSLLSDEQKARLTALGNDQRQTKTTGDTTGALGQSCGMAPAGVMEWPAAEIDQTVHPSESQRASLVALQNATAQAAELLKASCLTSDPLTPPARLAAVGKRLDTMLQAVKMVRSALNDFYGSLSDEQKANFEAIGPQRMSQGDSSEAAPPADVRRHRRGIPSPERIIRRLLSPFGSLQLPWTSAKLDEGAVL
jgi:LTXXQ motif family protein